MTDITDINKKAWKKDEQAMEKAMKKKDKAFEKAMKKKERKHENHKASR